MIMIGCPRFSLWTCLMLVLHVVTLVMGALDMDAVSEHIPIWLRMPLETEHAVTTARHKLLPKLHQYGAISETTQHHVLAEDKLSSLNDVSSMSTYIDFREDAILPVKLHRVAVQNGLTPALNSAGAGYQVRVTAWRGRIGNNIMQFAHALVYAKLVGATTVRFPDRRKDKKKLGRFFDVPTVLPLTKSPDWKVNQQCLPVTGDVTSDVFSKTRCNGVKGNALREVITEQLQPRMIVPLAKCVKAPDRKDEAELLTMHVRSGDVFLQRSTAMQHSQPPCSFYSKIIKTGNRGGPYKDVLIVTERDQSNPCVSALQKKHPGVVRVQSGSLTEDACALMRARNLVLSFSTFSQSLAWTSGRVKRIYGNHNRFFCTSVWGRFWEGVEINMYEVPEQSYARHDVNVNKAWMTDFPESRISGPTDCKSRR